MFNILSSWETTNQTMLGSPFTYSRMAATKKTKDKEWG